MSTRDRSAAEARMREDASRAEYAEQSCAFLVCGLMDAIGAAMVEMRDADPGGFPRALARVVREDLAPSLSGLADGLLGLREMNTSGQTAFAASEALKSLMFSATASDPGVRAEAAAGLRDAALDALSAVAVLGGLFSDENRDVRSAARGDDIEETMVIFAALGGLAGDDTAVKKLVADANLQSKGHRDAVKAGLRGVR